MAEMNVPAEERMPDEASARRVVVILGTGRSGTSLTAKILAAIGVRMETTLHRPNEMNPEGYFEDREVIAINQAILDKLSLAPPHIPAILEDSRPAIQPELDRLKAHLRASALSQDGIWGFKDPRVSTLLPIYRRIFQQLGLVPVFVYCARAPEAVVASLLDATPLNRQRAEQIYLTRSLMALRDSGAVCHVIHYEKLLADPLSRIDALSDFVWSGQDAPVRLSDEDKLALVDTRLNRSPLKAQPLANPLARRMGALIAGMDGTSYDRETVMAELQEIGAIHDGYCSWLGMIATHQKRQPGAVSGDDPAPQIAELQRKLTRQDNRVAALKTKVESQARELGAQDASALRLASLRDHYARQQEAHEETLNQLRAATAELAEMTAARAACPGPDAREQIAAAVLADELAWLQAENLRLREEHGAAVERARLRLSDLDRVKLDLHQARAKLAARPAPAPAAAKPVEVPVPVPDPAQQQLAEARQRIADMEAGFARMAAMREQLQLELNDLLSSTRLRAGSAMVDALRRPGLNTLALPWRLICAGRRPASPALALPDGDDDGAKG
ncbi:MAG: hypothetical protein ACK5LJ_14930 [Paracoccus sp. (in: a-proteobacteria)]